MKKSVSKFIAVALSATLAFTCLVFCAACGNNSSSSNNSSQSSSSQTSSSDGTYKLTTSGKLTVALSADYPPMEYLDGDTVKGFDADLMTEVAKRLGLTVEFKNQAFDTLVTSVSSGSNVDCAASSITVDSDRAKEIDFTDTYYDSNLAIVTLKDSGIKSRSDLTSAEIGAQSGTSGESWIQENLKDAKYTPYQETPDLLQALRTGKIKAAVYDEPVAQSHVNGEYNDCQILETIATGEQYAIIVNKNNSALTEAINKVLKEIQSDGTMQTLKNNAFK